MMMCCGRSMLFALHSHPMPRLYLSACLPACMPNLHFLRGGKMEAMFHCRLSSVLHLSPVVSSGGDARWVKNNHKPPFWQSVSRPSLPPSHTVRSSLAVLQLPFLLLMLILILALSRRPSHLRLLCLLCLLCLLSYLVCPTPPHPTPRPHATGAPFYILRVISYIPSLREWMDARRTTICCDAAIFLASHVSRLMVSDRGIDRQTD
ncbi:uncharacterized protein J3D65DRAFT_78310 [Phyllosticta citribraziliensis]|uniref:Uncharacterized protein n=1 Tax=Phyllosticta citribraziliensis TaxID=989973 RepID=A0ABR1LDI5_9PEZI